MAEENKSTAPVKVSTNAVKKNEGKLPFGKRVAKWFREMRSEARKVIWPTPKQTLNNTGVALGMMVVSALVLWGFDTLAKLGVKGSALLVGAEASEKVVLASGNNPKLATIESLGVNVYELLKYDQVVFSKDAILALQEVVKP